VIPAAEQLDNLTKKRVLVVPTRSVAQGLAALIEYSPTATDPAAIARDMAAAAERVTTAQVTRAVRDATTPAGPVRAGDWLGLVEGTPRVIVSSRPSAARRVLDACAGLGRGAAHRARIAERRGAAALTAALSLLLDRAVPDDADLVTVITGSGALPSATAAAERWLAEHRPGVPVEVLAGGQPLHPYVVGVE
jgi:dihydroxyacetone kinase-like predicted kinase